MDEETAQDPQRFYKLLVDEQVTIPSQTPSALKHLIREDTLARGKLALRYIFLGGEALQLSVLHDWVRHHPLDAIQISPFAHFFSSKLFFKLLKNMIYYNTIILKYIYELMVNQCLIISGCSYNILIFNR